MFSVLQYYNHLIFLELSYYSYLQIEQLQGVAGTRKLYVPSTQHGKNVLPSTAQNCVLGRKAQISKSTNIDDSGSMTSVEQNVSKARKAMCGCRKSTPLAGEILDKVKQCGVALGLDSASGLLYSSYNGFEVTNQAMLFYARVCQIYSVVGQRGFVG